MAGVSFFKTLDTYGAKTIMTWIKTIPLSEADERLRKALEEQQKLYPEEYRVPVHPTDDGSAGIVASHTLIPKALYHAFATFGAL
ncbi:MAG TPA: hypothetical protein PLP42_02555 [Acidobacteriota bacterium]|jgi:hypothetical protein|nr:hypothetical protein [Acidobacteriota bacterium]